MNFNKMSLALSLIFASLPATGLALDAVLSLEEQANLEAGYGWRLPASFPLPRLERLVTKIVASTEDIGFRYLGVEQDFFHGHVLFEEVQQHDGTSRLRPRAILYHMQEEAYSAYWRHSIDAKYKYLDVTTRNWIQWLDKDPTLDGSKIENARIYLDTHKKSPDVFWKNSQAPIEGEHYTISAKLLDPAKLGFRVYGNIQFDFVSSKCGVPVQENSWNNERGPIQFRYKDQDLCLVFRTTSELQKMDP